MTFLRSIQKKILCFLYSKRMQRSGKTWSSKISALTGGCVLTIGFQYQKLAQKNNFRDLNYTESATQWGDPVTLTRQQWDILTKYNMAYYQR